MIKLNPNLKPDEIKDIHAQIKDNEGFCPCRLEHIPENKCICKEFLEQKEGPCLCGLYIKTVDFF